MTERTSQRTERGTASDRESRRGLALLFPGQGSQRVGMGQHVAEISEAARQVFAQADEVLGVRISRLCFEGSREELEETENAQPAILTTSLAYLAYLREQLGEMGRRLRPSFMVGHSLGQYTAAVASGALEFSDGLRLVRERGRMMADWARNRPGGLASVLGLDEHSVDAVCREASPEGKVGVAVLNTPGQTVIAGEEDALEQAMALARARGGRVMRLPISVPSHIPLMRDVARELAKFIDTLPFREPETPLVSNVSAKLLTTAEELREELSGQICAAVQWVRCVGEMANQNVVAFVEVGPGRALSKMVRRIEGERAQTFSAEDASSSALLALAATVPLAVPKRTSDTGSASTTAEEAEIAL